MDSVALFAKKQGKVSLIVCLLCSGWVCVELVEWMQDGSLEISAPRGLVAVRALHVGEMFSLRDFTVSSKVQKQEGILTDQEIHRLSGAKIAREVSKGAFLREQDLLFSTGPGFAGRVPRGMRAFPISIANTVPLRAGDFVDVFWSQEGQEGLPLNMLQKVRVLGVRVKQEQQDVILSVTPGDLPLMEKVSEYGKISVALRNPDEVLVRGQTSNTNLERYFQRKKNRVEILSEDSE